MPMEREDALEVFLAEQMAMGIAAVEEIESYSRVNRDAFRRELEGCFSRLSARIGERQRAGEKDSIFCIYICFPRSDFYVREGKIRIYAYDSRFFLDTDPLWEEMAFDGAEQIIWKLEDALLSELGRYKNKIAGSDVRTLIQTQYVPYLIGYMTDLARYAVRKGSGDCFQHISVTDDFSVMAGEYQGEFEEIFVTQKVDTKGVALRDFLRIHRKEECTFCCRLYQDGEAQELDLQGINLTKSRLERMDFSGADLSGASLMQTQWRQCSLSGACLKGTKLFGAVFDRSDLRGCDFSGSIGPVLPAILSAQLTLGMNEVSFTGSNLTDAKFIRTDLRGADFRGALFQRTDFTDALLDGAVFDRGAWKEAGLTQEQRERINEAE